MAGCENGRGEALKRAVSPKVASSKAHFEAMARLAALALHNILFDHFAMLVQPRAALAIGGGKREFVNLRVACQSLTQHA